MKITDRRTHQIFPTPLFLSNVEGNLQKYVDLVYKDRKNGEGSYHNKHQWKSEDNYAKRTEWKELVDSISEEITKVLDDYGVVRDGFDINNMWVQIYSADGYIERHIHPNSYFSGILYLKTYPDCGKTVFFSGTEKFIAPELVYNDINYDRLWIESDVGKLVIFPSWLAHAATQGEDSEEDRITLAFTIMPKVKVNKYTETYDYK
jgi:uncharacterized protein (TIGR02466 family)